MSSGLYLIQVGCTQRRMEAKLFQNIGSCNGKHLSPAVFSIATQMNVRLFVKRLFCIMDKTAVVVLFLRLTTSRDQIVLGDGLGSKNVPGIGIFIIIMSVW